eukprot:gene9407-1615_t
MTEPGNRIRKRRSNVLKSVFGEISKMEDITEQKENDEMDWKTFKDEIYVETRNFPFLLKNEKHGEYLIQAKKHPGKVVHNIFDSWQVVEHYAPLYVPEPLRYKKETSHMFILDGDKKDDEIVYSISLNEKLLGVQELGVSNSVVIKRINSENNLKAEVTTSPKRESLQKLSTTSNTLSEGVSFLKKHSSLGRSTFLKKAKSKHTVIGSVPETNEEPLKKKEKQFYPSLFERNHFLTICSLLENTKTIFPPDVLYNTEKIDFTNNLLSFCKPCDWKPTEESFCGRYVDQSFQFFDSVEFLVTHLGQNLKTKSHEILYCTLALYDVSENRKVSEDFNFQIINKDIIKDNEKSSVLFSCVQAKPSIHLVLTVQVKFCGNHAQAMAPYANEPSNSAIKVKVDTDFKQRVFWTFCKMFTDNGKLNTGKIKMDQLYQIPPDTKKFDYFEILSRKKGKAGWQDLDNKIKYGIDGDFDFEIQMFDLEKHSEKYPLMTTLSNTQNPNISLQNLLFIYPESFSANISGVKYPTIGFDVSYRENDEAALNTFFHSSITHATKNPFFYEEIKFDLPIILDKRAIIIFTFYNITDDEKQNIIGYSFLPLYQNENILSDASTTLPVFKSLSGAFSETKKKSELTKSTFTLQYNVISSIYLTNSVLQSYFSCLQTFERTEKNSPSMELILKGLLKNFEEIQKLDFTAIFNHFPQILNSLFEIIGNIIKYAPKDLSKELQFSALKTIIGVVKNVAQSEGGKRSFSLSSYIKYQYREFMFENPIHLTLLDLLLDFLDQETSSNKDESTVSYLDLWKFNYFFFEVILKSIAINLNKTNSIPDYSDNQGWTKKFPKNDDFCGQLKNFVTEFCINMFQSYKKDPEVCKNANRHLALFIRDLIPILHKSQIYEVITTYPFIEMLEDPFFGWKLDFFHIIFDSDHIIAIIADKSCKYLAGKYVGAVLDAIKQEEDHEIRETAIHYITNHLAKIDDDIRYQSKSAKEFIADSYWSLISTIVKTDDLLQYCEINLPLQNFLDALLWLISNKNDDTLNDWMKKLKVDQLTNLFDLLNSIVLIHTSLFDDPSIVLDDEYKRNTESLLYLNNILSILLDHLKPIFDQFKENQENLNELLNSISEIFMNLLLNKTKNYFSEKEAFLKFDSFVKLSNFLELYIDDLIVRDDDVKDVKMGKIFALKKLESRWRKLVGAVLANVTHPLEEKTHPIVIDCLTTLIAPYTMEDVARIKKIETNDETDLFFDTEKRVKGATLEKLMECLFQVGQVEKDFPKMFILTYPSFATSKQVLLNVISFFEENFNENMMHQIAVLGFIPDWLKRGYYDLDNSSIATLIKFLDNNIMISKFNTAHNKIKRYTLFKLLNAVEENQFKLQIKEEFEIPKNVKLEKLVKPKVNIHQFMKFRKFQKIPNPFDYEFNILEWSSDELAKQLTIIETELFKNIEPKECFGLGWSKPNKLDLAPNIVAITDRFNYVSHWVKYIILQEKDLKRRQLLLQKFLDIAKYCVEKYFNFTTIYQIISALDSAGIHRLKKTWDGLKSSDMKIYEHTKGLVTQPPYTELKKALKEAAAYPTVPFIGVYLTELTFITDGNPDTLEYNDKKLINFFKRRLFSETILRIQFYQQNTYQLARLPYLNFVLTQSIKETPEMDDKKLFDESLILEPRNKK